MVKITALTDEPTPVAADLVAIVDNVAVTPVTKKATLNNVLAVYDSQTATLTNKTLTGCTGLVATTGLTATGTKDATTFLRGDDTWAVVDASPLTTKGDVYTYSTGNARLGVGANGLVLTADSTTATGLSWASGGGGASAMVIENV